MEKREYVCVCGCGRKGSPAKLKTKKIQFTNLAEGRSPCRTGEQLPQGRGQQSSSAPCTLQTHTYTRTWAVSIA